MSREVRGQYLKDKFKTMSRHALGTYIHRRRFIENLDWYDIESEVGLSEKAMRRLLRQAGLYGGSVAKGISTKNAKRNEKIIEVVRQAALRGEKLSQQKIADTVSAAGFPVNRSTVNAVLDRARGNGELTSEYEEVKAKAGVKKRVNYAFVGQQGPGTPEGLPPRTPELLARGRVSYDDLGPKMCRYTPSEEAPFLFCGEAVTGKGSWCKDCRPLIYRKPADVHQAKTSQRTLEALAA